MHRTITSATIAAALLMGLTGLSACGSSKDSSSPTQTPSSSAAPSASPSASGSASASASPTPSTSSKAPTKRDPNTALLTIKDYAYAGATTVAAGTRITVTNKDDEAHTVTTDSGDAFNVVVPPGTSKTFTAPRRAGTYAYHCTYHANMHGKLTVS